MRTLSAGMNVYLSGTKRVCDAFNRVDNWTSKVIGRVCLVLGASAMVGGVIEAVEHWVAHSSIDRRHVDLGAETELGGVGITS